MNTEAKDNSGQWYPWFLDVLNVMQKTSAHPNTSKILIGDHIYTWVESLWAQMNYMETRQRAQITRNKNTFKYEVLSYMSKSAS